MTAFPAPTADRAPDQPVPLLRHSLRHHYQVHIQGTDREGRFLISASFLLTFAIVRFITYAIRDHWLPFLHDVKTKRGLHIHHMVYGITLLLIVGYLSLSIPETRGKRLLILSLLYGGGAALTLDEFALWLNVRDVYWAREGRESVDAAIGAGALFALGSTGGPFWASLWRDLTRRRGM